MSRLVNWGGLEAMYSDREWEVVENTMAAARAGQISDEQARREIIIFHEAKAILGASLMHWPPPRRTVLDPARQVEVEYVREEAIQRADEHVEGDWKAHAHEMITLAARRFPEFTSEQVWEVGLRRPEEGSSDGDALGPALRRAAREGIIVNTGRLEQATNRPQRHNNPKRVWRSLIYEGP